MFCSRVGFRGRRIEWRYFRLHEIQDGGWPPSWKISNGHISGTGRPIDFVFDPRVGFSGTADRMDLLPVAPNPRFGPHHLGKFRMTINQLSDPLA